MGLIIFIAEKVHYVLRTSDALDIGLLQLFLSWTETMETGGFFKK